MNKCSLKKQKFTEEVKKTGRCWARGTSTAVEGGVTKEEQLGAAALSPLSHSSGTVQSHDQEKQRDSTNSVL